MQQFNMGMTYCQSTAPSSMCHTKEEDGCKSDLLVLERFSDDCRKTKTKAITPTNHNRNKQLHEPITIPSNHLKLARSAGKITRTWCDCFGFASHWLKNWRDSFKPITKRSNRNHVITFDSHLKTA